MSGGQIFREENARSGHNGQFPFDEIRHAVEFSDATLRSTGHRPAEVSAGS